MKIPESIIIKYQLFPSCEQCGNSFVNNLLIFKSNNSLLENYRLMECDINGNTTQYITIIDKGNNKAWETTPEFLEDVDLEIMMASML